MRASSGNKNYEIGEPHLVNVNTEAHLVADSLGHQTLKLKKKGSQGQIITKFHAQKQGKMPFGKEAKEKQHDYLQENIKKMGPKMRASQAVAEINKKMSATHKGTSSGLKSNQLMQRQQRMTSSSQRIKKEHENVSTTPNQLYFKQGVANIRVRNSIESSGGSSQEPKYNNFMATGPGQIRKGGDDVYNPRSKRQQSRQASSAQSSTNSTNFVRYHTITEPDDDQVIISQMTPSMAQQQVDYQKRHSGGTRSVPRTQVDDQDEEPYIISSSKFQTLKANRQAIPLTQNLSPSRNSHRDYLISNLLQQSTPTNLNRVNSANQREVTKPLLPSTPQPISSSNLNNLVQNFQRQNQNMRVSIQQVGIHITSLANSAYNLKKDQSVAAIGKNIFFQEISSSIQSINDLFNTVHFMILENDDKLTQIGASIEILNHQLNSQDQSDKVFEMEQQMNKLAKMHQTLQKQMFETTKENKRLSYECERAARTVSDDQRDDHQRQKDDQLRDQLLDENRLLNQRIEDLQNQAQVLVDAPCSNCQKFTQQSLRFLTAMRTLQRSVNSKEQPPQGGGLKQAKQDFELQKKLLETLIKDTRQKSANTQISESSVQNFRTLEQLYESQIKNKAIKKELKEQSEKLGAWKTKVNMIQNQINEKDEQIKDMQEEQKALNEESRSCIQRLESQLHATNQLIQEKDYEMQNMIVKPVTNSAVMQTSFVDEKQNLTQSENSNLQLKVEELMSENAQLEKQISMQDGALNNLRLQNKALNNQQNDSNIKEKDLIEKKVTHLENQISTMSKTHLSQLEEAKKARESLQQQLKVEKDQNELLSKQIDDLQVLQSVQTENKELKTNLAALEDINKKNVNKLEAQTSVTQIKTNLISELNDKLEKSQVEQDKLKQEQEQSTELVQTQTQKINELEQKVKNLQEAENKHQEEAKALAEDVNQADSMRTKHQQTLEKNRDLIHLLKEQLQKSVDKQKALENNNSHTGEIQKQKIDLLQQEIQKLKKESERAKTLENQVKQLKVQFSEKMTNLSGKVDDLENDNDKKDELINEANKALEELSDEKHDIMAKFKHLVQVYVHQVTQSVNQSSYKGDDSSLSLNVCFDQLQEVLEKAQGQTDQPVQDINIKAEITQEFEAEKSKVLRAADEAKSQLNQCFEKHQELPKQVDLFQQMFAQNHEEIQRQVRMLPLLQRKLANYKKKLQEKVHQNRELSKKMSDQQKEQSQKMQSLAKKMSDVEMDSQQEKEKELEKANAKDAALIEQKNQILQLEKDKEQLQKDKDQLLLEKDEVVEKAKQQQPAVPVKEETKKKESNSDDDSESDDQDERIEELELENMELLAKLAKTERELQDAREAQQELQKEVNEDDSNVEVKLDENLKQKFDEFQQKIEEIHRKIFKVKEEVLSKMQEIRDCDEDEDPTYKNLEDVNFMIDGEQDPGEEDSLQVQLDELRSEQKELLKDLYDLRIKVERNVELEDDKELQTMKDDLQFFNAENLELRMKIKALVKQNIEQKISMQELKKANSQKMVTNVSGIINNPITSNESSLMISKDRINLFDDSVELGDVTRGKPNQEALQHISKLSLNDNANTSRLDLPDDSIQTLITASDQSTPKIDLSVLNETQISHLQDQLLQQQENVTQFQQEMLDIVNQVRLNRTQIESSSTPPSVSVDKKAVDIDELQSSENSEKETYQDTILHVKGTLIMYLKKTPIIDLNNEILLKVIFSMLEFTPHEISELLAARQDLPAYKIDKSSTKGKQQAKKAPNLLSVQVNSNGNNSSRNQITDTLSQASARNNGTVNTDNSVGNGGLSGAPFTPKAGGLKVLDAMRQSLNRTPSQKNSDNSRNNSQNGGEQSKDKVKTGLMGLFKRSQSKDVLQPSTPDDDRDPKARKIYDVQSQDKHPLSERRSLQDKIIPIEKYRDPNNKLEDTQF